MPIFMTPPRTMNVVMDRGDIGVAAGGPDPENDVLDGLQFVQATPGDIGRQHTDEEPVVDHAAAKVIFHFGRARVAKMFKERFVVMMDEIIESMERSEAKSLEN